MREAAEKLERRDHLLRSFHVWEHRTELVRLL